ncbi:MAG: hypothetical protein AABZ39_02010 [Spirochaetota bacterium]
MARLCVICALLSGVLSAASPGTYLLRDDFEKSAAGGKPAGWVAMSDEGNEIAVVAQPAIGTRAVRLSHTSGTVWKPYLSGVFGGGSDTMTAVDFDVYFTGRFTADAKSFFFIMRGPVDTPYIRIALGGPSGAAPEGRDGFFPLNVPIRTNTWYHISVRIDALSKGESGTYTLIISDATRVMPFENIPLCIPKSYAPSKKIFPAKAEGSPGFTLPEAPGKDVYIDNVSIQVIDKK